MFVAAGKASEIDNLLHRDFELVSEALYFDSSGNLSWRPTQHLHSGIALESAPVIEVLDPRGNLAFRRADGQVTRLPLGGLDSQAQGYINISLNGVRLRALQDRVVVEGRTYVVRIARSTELGQQQLRSLMLWSVVMMPIGLVVAAFAGWMIARRALNPISQMTAEALRISAEKPSARLPVINENDELGRLAATFNAAFERIDQSFQQLRTFTGDAAHELRTPLAALRAVGENALRGPSHISAFREAIGSMLEECERLTILVNTLLFLARADQGRVSVNIRSLEISELAAQASSMLRTAAELKGQLLLESGTGTVRANADPTLLLQVMLNIIDNAIHHTPSGTIINISSFVAGTNVTIEIRDDGPGIPTEQHERIFDRFYRLDESRSRGNEGGFGLGLAVSRALMKVQNGCIEVDSQPGQGTAFRILLPHAPGS